MWTHTGIVVLVYPQLVYLQDGMKLNFFSNPFAKLRYKPLGFLVHKIFILQAEELDEHNVQQTPPGFHVIFLPFADDFRKIKFEEDLPRGNHFISKLITSAIVFIYIII